MVHPNYRQKEVSLLSIAKNGWTSYLLYQEIFASFSPYYSKTLGEKQLKKVSDTFEQYFNSEKEKKAVNEAIKQQSILVCQHWQLLKRYIQGAYPKRFQASKLKIAGKEFYFNAYRYHFESVVSLIQLSTIFLKDFKILLTLENNMPPSFVDDYEAVCERFNLLYIKYILSRQNAKEGKFEKIEQLNQIHKALAEMFNDAKAIFIKNQKTKSLFTFSLKSIPTNNSNNQK